MTRDSGTQNKKLRAEVEALRAKASELVLKDPRKAATIVTAWVNQPAAGAKKPTPAGPAAPSHPSIKQLKKKAG